MSDGKKKPFYISTPIYYVNARPHIGHAYTTIACDTLARYHRLNQRDVFFLTGTDMHGDKIVKAAEKENMSAENYAEVTANLFQNAWKELGLTPNDFIRTTQDRHKKTVQKILSYIHSKGDIYTDFYEGLYCFGCERYLTEKEIDEEGKCPTHLTAPQLIKEKNYFFKMQKYLPVLKEYLQKNKQVIKPDIYRNEVLGTIDELLAGKEDLSISRPKSRLQWGISLPFDDTFVTYVWFDALINYVSALDYPEGDNFKKYWPESVHMIAKDILKPHAIFWPTMLLAADIPIFKHLAVHGYWLGWGDLKMSKSLGNAKDPVELAKSLSNDALRFFLMREMNFGSDAKFTEEAIYRRLNTDLANELGNLSQRTLSMLKKYNCGPDSDAPEHIVMNELEESASAMKKNYHTAFDEFQFHKAIEAVFTIIKQMNKITDDNKPWSMAKENSTELKPLLNTLLKAVVFCMYYLRPVLPEKTMLFLETLGLSPDLPFPENIRSIKLQSMNLAEWPMLFARMTPQEKPD